jgi:hypothetical protein
MMVYFSHKNNKEESLEAIQEENKEVKISEELNLAKKEDRTIVTKNKNNKKALNNNPVKNLKMKTMMIVTFDKL